MHSPFFISSRSHIFIIRYPRYHTLPLAFPTLVSIAASASGPFLLFVFLLWLTFSSLGFPCANWRYHNGQPRQVAAGEDNAYAQQISSSVSAPLLQSGGVSGDDREDESCDDPSESPDADLFGQKRRSSQQAASASDNISKDQGSSSTGASNNGTNNSTNVAGTTVSSAKGAGLRYFKDIATMTSNIHAT